MKLAFSTNAYTNGKYTIIDAINKIADAGYRGVEILADTPLVWPFDISKEQLQEIKNVLRKRNINVSNVNAFTCSNYWLEKKWTKGQSPPGSNFGPVFCDYEEEFRRQRIDYTKKVIDFTVAIDGRDISTCSGVLPKRGNRALSWKNMLDGLKEVVFYAEKKNVRINIEYEPGLLVGSGEEAWQVVQEINSPNFGLNFDIGHSFCCDENVVALIQKFTEKIHTVHIEDIGVDDKGRPVHYHLVPGQGTMPLKKIFQTLKNIEYQGWYIVELYTYFKKPVYATIESMKYLKNLKKN